MQPYIYSDCITRSHGERTGHMKKNLPVWLVSLIDILLAGSILCTFCYYHHVRILWGELEEPEAPEQFTHAADERGENTDAPTEGGDGVMLDTSGDFGAAFAHIFSPEGAVTLNDDAQIREYASESGLTLQGHPDGKFLSLYRSHDIFVSLLQVETDLYYEPKNKTYYVQYYVFDIYIRNIKNLFTVTTNKRDYTTEQLIARGEEASGGAVIAAMNGDYFGNVNNCLVAERNGSLIRESSHIESDVCVLYYDGRLETYTPKTYDLAAIKAQNPYQIWNFGPSLLDADGKALTKYETGRDKVIDQRHPRAGLGYYEPGHYSFIVVDGRSGDSQGVRVPQLGQLFEELGCTAAYNMDGGDSAQAYFGHTMIRGDEERGDDQRNLYDIICIGEVKKNENG